MARCRECNGCGLVPCMLCAGWEDPMLPPDPVHGPVPPDGAYFGGTDTLAWLEQFPETQAARRRRPAVRWTEQAAAGDARGPVPGEAPAGPEEWLARFLDVKARLRRRRADAPPAGPAPRSAESAPVKGRQRVPGGRGAGAPADEGGASDGEGGQVRPQRPRGRPQKQPRPSAD